MNLFPLGIDLRGKRVVFVGQGEQIRQKAEKLEPFGAEPVFCGSFGEADARQRPSLVIVGDIPLEEAERIAVLCGRFRIPVNVVDVPHLCSFYFPALITRGDLTVSVSTGGACPAAAACLRQKLEQLLPPDTEEILEWLGRDRAILREQGILTAAAAAAFSAGRLLTAEELAALKNGSSLKSSGEPMQEPDMD